MSFVNRGDIIGQAFPKATARQVRRNRVTDAGWLSKSQLSFGMSCVLFRLITLSHEPLGRVLSLNSVPAWKRFNIKSQQFMDHMSATAVPLCLCQ